MSTDNQPVKFEWTDELVKEFYEQVYCTPSINPEKDIEDFKASKQPKRERIEVLSMAIKKQWGDGKIDFECQLSYGISKYLFPAIKQAIESVLNNDTVVERGIQDEFDAPRMYLQSEVDTIRRETWEAAREHHIYNGLKDGIEVPVIKWHFQSLERFLNLNTTDYLSSLNSKEGGKEFIGPASLAEHPKCKKEQPTNDNAFVWDESLVGELTEWASSNDWTYLPSKNKWFNEEDEINITPITTEQLINKFKQSKQSAPEPSALPTKEYEILSFSGKIANYGFTSSPRTEEWVNKQIEEGYPIHSVRRLSDNVVFSVGEEVCRNNYNDKIHGFEIGGNRMKVAFSGGYEIGFFDLSDLIKLPPTPTEPVVTDNSDVACLSIKDVFSCYDDGSYIQHIPTVSALYKKLEQKVNQKLKQ